jgi:DNA-nicking Smr family endonuclease
MRAPRRSRLSETDIAEWANYVRHVLALPGRARPETAEPAVPEAAAAAFPRPPPLPAHAPRLAARPNLGAVIIGMQPPGVDNATWQRFRTGKMAASRKLDLHGRTAQPSYQALASLLRSAHAEGLRCVEVITGRGSGEGGGVLRRELPMWLNLPELRPLVLAAAHPHAANTGSVRILLRRAR